MERALCLAIVAPMIFISYSHDSEEHRDKVLALAERLREDGLDAQLDQYVQGAPEQGWPRWMLDQIDTAEFVLVVCTPMYYLRFRGHEEAGKGKGADWEGAAASTACTSSVPSVAISPPWPASSTDRGAAF